jgi:anti-sigma B factor antagonist
MAIMTKFQRQRSRAVLKNITIASAPHAQQGDITILSVKGFIDTNTAPEFDRAFQKSLAERRFNLVVDLKETNYISSVGWGIFIGEIKRIRTQGGNLFLAGLSPEVNEAYELLELESILKAFPDAEAAVQKGFGRTKGKKASSAPVVASRAAVLTPVASPASAPTQPQAVPAPTQEYTRMTRAPEKRGFLGRLIRPWTWF